MAAIRNITEGRHFLTRALVFAAIGVLPYGALYAWSERLVWRHAQTNKFFLVKSAPPTQYDYVILGASHAAALGYQDMTPRLEALTQKKIVNLALVGGGVRVSRLIFEYFLTRHRTEGVVYVIDSFAFYARTWNEDRLQDTRLFLRAPFDLSLARELLSDPSTRSVGVDVLTGFSKINNKDRFASDVSPEESTRFNRSYRPVQQIDDQRLTYLYAQPIDQAVFARYMAEFEDFLRDVQSRGIRVLVVKPPIPERIVRWIPGEQEFDGRLKELLARLDIPLHDFTHAGNDEKLFYDTDHLNKDGVVNFFQAALAPLLAQ
ncbi:MAG: hypothetical protein FJW27_14305 [Acidimicrobiia bacterium]|nr:hypothetical protein [Acidimicrobiia bacterium]